MSTTTDPSHGAPSHGAPPQGDLLPHEQLSRSFKAAMGAVRRLRGRETQRPGALSTAQYGLLHYLFDTPPRSARELAEAATLTPATVTQMLEGLEEAGLVERVRSQLDKRIVLTALTARGRELVEAHRAEFEPRWRAAVAEFSGDELRTAARVLDSITAFFDDWRE